MIIGIDMDREAIEQRLAGALLTDAELAEGRRAWADYDDPLPPWDLDELINEANEGHLVRK